MTKTIPDQTKTFRGQRLTLGLTQVALARQCRARGAKVSDVTLSALERDLWAPRPLLRSVLCTILDLPITYFDESEQERRKAEREAATKDRVTQ